MASTVTVVSFNRRGEKIDIMGKTIPGFNRVTAIPPPPKASHGQLVICGCAGMGYSVSVSVLYISVWAEEVKELDRSSSLSRDEVRPGTAVSR